MIIPEFIEVRFSPTNEFIKQKYTKKVKSVGGTFVGNDKFRYVIVPNTYEGRDLINDICHKFHLPQMQIIMRDEKLNKELATITWCEVEWNGVPDYDYVSEAIKQYENKVTKFME